MDIQLRISSPDDLTTESALQIRRPLSRPTMTRVASDAFIRVITAEPVVHGGLVRTVVRAFLAAALRDRDARTPDGWRSIIHDLRYVLGSALRDGVERRRPVRAHSQLEVGPIDGQGLPVRLVHALVSAYVAARMSGDESATPEGRSRILGETRELVWDGMLDAVKQVPCPPPPPPQAPARASRRTPPARGR